MLVAGPHLMADWIHVDGDEVELGVTVNLSTADKQTVSIMYSTQCTSEYFIRQPQESFPGPRISQSIPPQLMYSIP